MTSLDELSASMAAAVFHHCKLVLIFNGWQLSLDVILLRHHVNYLKHGIN